MENPVVEGVILTAIFLACVYYITRKCITKFSGSASGGCSGCSSCGDASSKHCGPENSER